MTIPVENDISQTQPISDKELNFQRQRKMYEAELEKVRAENQELSNRIAQRQQNSLSDEDDDSEPYVDHKKLNKKLASFERSLEEKIDQKAEAKARTLIEQDRQSTYLRDTTDFNHVMNPDTIQKFADAHPRIAENILRMPDGFERQKLVYETIKALGIDKPTVKQPTVQEKIDANRKSPYYQPSGIGSAPYQSQGDFSDSGQKNAYDKMQELKKRIRL